MNTNRLPLVLGAVAGISAFLAIQLYKYTIPLPEPITKEVVREVKVPTTPKGVIVNLTIKDLYNDLSTRYSHISSTHRHEIMEAIAYVSDKHNISPLVIYCLISVESSFRWWIQHPLATVQDYNKKKVKTRAVGLGGVIYEIWGKELVSNKVIETKSDLYTIKGNIHSIGYIYSKLKAMPLHPKAKNSIESGLIRYFGGGYKSYFNKIDKEIAQLLKLKVYK